MNRVWRYVKQVEAALPPGRRVEIVGELYARLKAEQGELETRLGRKASDAEIDALLAAQGDPRQVATRFTAAPGRSPHDLVERYLAAVGRLLPDGVSRFDILAELRDVLTAKVEALEEATGRPATKDDLAGVLKDFGPPEVVAHGYRARPALIGAELTPYFWMAQRMAIGAVLALVLVVAVIRGLGATRPFSAVTQAVSSMWEAGVFTFGVVTLVFILADQWAPRWSPGKLWEPRHLPETHIRQPRSRFESLVALVFDAVFILWWAGLLTVPNLAAGRGDVDLSVSFSSAWAPLHAPILALAVLTAVTHVADVLYPAWSRVRAVVAIAGCLGGVAIVSLLFASGGLVDVTAPDGAGIDAALRERVLDRVLKLGLAGAAALWMAQAGWEAWRLTRSLRGVRTATAA